MFVRKSSFLLLLTSLCLVNGERKPLTLTQRLRGDGLLYHSLDFLGALSSWDCKLKGWKKDGFFMTSFSYVNSVHPKIASWQGGAVQKWNGSPNAGILVDPTHPGVTIHLIGNYDGYFSNCKGKGAPSFGFSPCHELTFVDRRVKVSDMCKTHPQISKEMNIMECAMHQPGTLAFKYINKCYASRMDPAKFKRSGLPTGKVQTFDTSDVIQKLKENERRVQKYSEIVVSAPPEAIVGVMGWNTSTPWIGSTRADKLCEDVGKYVANVACFKTYQGVTKVQKPGSLDL